MEKKNKEEIYGSLRMVLTKDQIMTFVAGLHEEQEKMIELVVNSKERNGFPEARAVIDHIRGLK